MGRSKVDEEEKKANAGVYVKNKILDALGKKETKEIGEKAIEQAYEKFKKTIKK